MGLDTLLHETPVSAYWVGFIMADGYLSEKRLVVTLAKRDEQHLTRLAQYIGLGTPIRQVPSTGAVTLTRQEPDTVFEIRKRFDFKPQKTYNPPNTLPYTDNDLLLSFLVGFIDGDGSINLQTGRKTAALRVVSHPVWESFLTSLSQKTEFGRVTMRGDGYVALSSHRHNEIVALKTKALLLNLPYLDRKWDRVASDLTVRGQMQYTVIDLLEKGRTPKEIMKETGCSKAYVSKLKKRSSHDHVLHE